MQGQAHLCGQFGKLREISEHVMLAARHLRQILQNQPAARLFPVHTGTCVVDADCMDLYILLLDESPEFTLGEPAVVVPTIRNQEQDLPLVPGAAHLPDCQSDGIEQCSAPVRRRTCQRVVDSRGSRGERQSQFWAIGEGDQEFLVIRLRALEKLDYQDWYLRYYLKSVPGVALPLEGPPRPLSTRLHESRGSPSGERSQQRLCARPRCQ